MKHFMLGAIVACALTAAACSSGDDSTSSTTTGPTTPVITENYSGTVQVGSFDVRPFTVAQSGGALAATLTAAGPPATIFMGFGIGSWDGTSCTLLSGGSVNTQAGAVAQLSGTVNSGNYCVMVYDIGNQSAPISYTWTMTHY